MKEDLNLFYKKKAKIKINKRKYSYSELLKWTDYDFATKGDYISVLFPIPSDVIDTNNRKVMKNIVRLSLRIMNFYGYNLEKGLKLKRIKSLDETGFYIPQTYFYLVQIMTVLNNIGLKRLSALFFLMICKSVKKDEELYNKIKKAYIFQDFLNTQPYVKKMRLNRFFQVLMNPFATEEELSDGGGEDGGGEDGGGEDGGGEEYNYDPNLKNEFKKGSSLARECNLLRGLNYTGNSCYQDSALLCLFARPNEFINKNILNKNISSLTRRYITCGQNKQDDIKQRLAIQEELKRITNSMRGLDDVEYCSNLRNLFKKCISNQNFFGRGTQDAGEFIKFLFNIFEVEGMKIKRIKKVYDVESPRNSITILNDTENVTPILDVLPTEYMDDINYVLDQSLYKQSKLFLDEENEYFHEEKKKFYNGISEEIKIIATPYLIINIHRLYFNERGKQVRSRSTINYNEYIVVGTNILQLSGIIVHAANHYTAYIKCGRYWHYYDDNPGGESHVIRPIGTFSEMYSKHPRTRTESTLFFYT